MADIMLNPRQCATVLRALGDETRFRILESLLVQEKCVSDLVRETRKTQPHVSHHLRILRDAGLVEGQRYGPWVGTDNSFNVNPKPQPTTWLDHNFTGTS